MVKGGSALHGDCDSQYLSADHFGCLPATGAVVTGELISWFIDRFERGV